MAMSAEVVEVALDIPAELGEGAIWDERHERLFWVDILLNRVYAYDPIAGSNLAYDVGDRVATVVPTEDNLLLIGLRKGLGWLDATTGRSGRLVDVEIDKPHTRINDGKCDPRGRFWAGTMCERAPLFDGGLYCLDKDLSITKKLTGIQCSNGLVWSKDGTQFFYVDTGTQEIWAFRYDADSGHLDERRVVTTIPRELGAPDGMTIDSDDKLWVALWGGGRVLRISPNTGHIELELPVPANNVTSVAFGGPNLDHLYVTTARVGQSEADLARLPLSGCLFCVKLPYRGQPTNRFAGGIRKLVV